MGPIPKALQEIRFQIPAGILDRAFKDTLRQFSIVPQDIDSLVRTMVIEPRVLVDCNLIGGVQCLIDLSGIPRMVPDERSSVWDVPPEILQGKTIVSPHSISYGYGYSIGFSNYNPFFDQMQQKGCGNAGILTAASALWAANANMPIVGSARVTMIGVNQVLVQDQVRIPDRVYLRAMLSHDSEMTNIQPASWNSFAKLCVLAVKAYIYNSMIIRLNQGEIVGGYELGIIRSKIEEYADADELYREYRDTIWYKTSMLNDHETHQRHIRNVMGHFI